jgi:tetratricopeptide (TPR) repeat protein
VKPGSGAKAFAEANVSLQCPVYFEAAPPDLPTLSPRGPLMRLAADGDPNEPQAWEFPVTPDQAKARYGRERGIRLQRIPGDLIVEPEPYERRWVAAYARAQATLGQARFKKSDFRGAAELLESARAVEPDRPALEIVHLLGICYYQLGDYDRAEPQLKLSLRLGPTARQSVRACSYLATICRKQGRMAESLRWQDQAMGVVGSDPELRREFDQFSRPR